MQISEISPIKNPNPASSPVSMSSDRKVLVDYQIYIEKKLMYLILSFYIYKYIPKSDSNHELKIKVGPKRTKQINFSYELKKTTIE